MKTLIALFAVALGATAVAADQTPQKQERESVTTQSGDKTFNRLDKNQDGQLSRTEAQTDSALTAQFASVDQDADGFVTKSEYTAAMNRGSQSQPKRDY